MNAISAVRNIIGAISWQNTWRKSIISRVKRILWTRVFKKKLNQTARRHQDWYLTLLYTLKT